MMKTLRRISSSENVNDERSYKSIKCGHKYDCDIRIMIVFDPTCGYMRSYYISCKYDVSYYHSFFAFNDLTTQEWMAEISLKC